ncbi:MAG: hypothetical protein FWF77_04865 [Defluviitaleaceae bacterium]|nr:hypothetical protein [Defluviitaleaceae bacterium]
MKCPNCLKNFSGSKKCPACKIDVVLYKGTVRLSDKLHNKGLERLKVGDFYHGIELLSKSVSINKNNVPSRNLLGLALFEVGHVGEALKHWIVSQSMLKDDNPATKYIESAHKNARKLEALNDAVDMYNQALEHIKHKSDDLAIIQLKKAVEINPRFVDALNLLTLCYLIQNERERAILTSERVLSIDVMNPVTLNYYAILNPGKKPPRLPAKGRGQPIPKGPYKAIDLEQKKKKNFHVAELFMFLIGIAVAAGALYFLLVPALRRSWYSERQLLVEEHEEASANYRDRLSRAVDDYNAREGEIANLEAELAVARLENDVWQRVRVVNQAYTEFLRDELRVAVGLLNPPGDQPLMIFDLPSDIQDLAQEILTEAYPRLGADYYAAGLAAFNANPRDSHMALIHLENAQRFLDEESAQWNRMLFMLGNLYFDEGRLEEANGVLTELYEHAPGLPSPFTGAERTRFGNMMAELEGLQ